MMATPVPKTPAGEGIDQWFHSLQQYETTLEEMAAASIDVKFKEELAAVEQWFKSLTEAECTASLYTLVQHSTQTQIRFLIAVLQQMAKSDPMTAGLMSANGASPMQLGQLKSATALSPLARSFTPNSAPGNAPQNLQFLPLASPIDTPPSSGAMDSAAILAQQRQRLNATRATQQQLSVPASAPILPNAENGGAIWGPPERRPATIDEEKDRGGKPTPSTGETALPQTPTENESWSNMVATPLMSMFPKGAGTAPQNASDAKMTLWNTEGVVPQIGDAAIYRRAQKGGAKKKTTSSGSSNGYTLNGTAAPLTTPVGIVPGTPYNLGMLSAMGLSPEAQLLAVQMFVNGIIPAGYVPPVQTQGHTGGRWRAQSSAGLKSSTSARSTGPKSASSNASGSAGINREHETDPELLKDIPAWLKALRLHKYAASFEGLTWQDMVMLDESALESRGVVTVGARKRFLRLFEAVKKSQGMIESTTEGGEKVEEVVSPAPVAVAAAAA